MKFLIGVGIGYAVGVLIAPSQGRVTRARIKERLDSTIREQAREIGAKAGEAAYEELKKAV